MTAEQHEALARLSEILEEAKALAEEAREIINAEFSDHLSAGDAYGAFRFVDSDNPYDTTLSSIVESIEEEG